MISGILIKSAGMEKQARHKYYPRPSMAGPERCIRQMVYHSNGTPEDTEMSDRLVMTIDDSIFHEYLTNDWMQKTAFKLHSAQLGVDVAVLDFLPALPEKFCTACGKMIPGNLLHGHIDGVFTDLMQIDREYEHKAINHFTFERYWLGAFPLDYFTQVAQYIIGLQRLNPAITEGCLLIKNKNTAQYIDFLLRYDSATDELFVLEIEHSKGEKLDMNDSPVKVIGNPITDAINKFRTVHEHTVAGTLPERPYSFDDWHCAYCSWDVTCWKGYEEEFEKFTEDIMLEDGIISTLKRHYDLGQEGGRIKKERDGLSDTIKELMKDKKGKKGRAGVYLVEYKAEKTTTLNKDKIPGPILRMATEEGIRETLRVKDTTPKPKKSVEAKVKAIKQFYGIGE